MKILVIILLFLSTVAHSQINVYLTLQPPTNSSTYDGFVMANAYTGQTPFTYVWNDTLVSYGHPNTPRYDTLFNLCPGVYTLDIYDANNDSLHLDFFLTSNDLTFNGTNPAPDTINYGIQNCSIDYSVPVDQAYLANVFLIGSQSPGGADSISVQWTVVQGTTTTQIYDTLIGYFPIGSDFVINAGIYCPDSIHAQVKVIQVYGYVDHTLGISSNTIQNVEVYPNPFSAELIISGIPPGNTSVKIFDLSGKLVYSVSQTLNNTLNLNLDRLTKGVYILEVQSSGYRQLNKLIKQ